MSACARLLLLAALPALAGRVGWCAEGEVVSVTDGVAPAPGPAFAPRQRLAAAAAAVGQSAALDCRVLRLGDKSVSWVRSSDLQILSHAGLVFTADARVSASEGRAGAGATRHSLRIERLRAADAGRYECQVNTEPKMSLFFNLSVVDEVVPELVVAVLERRTVRAHAGGVATLACEARYEPPPRALPLPPLDIRWRRADAHDSLSLQNTRGGISLDTERWPARVVSRLTLAELRAADAGAYVCAAADGDATATLRLLVSDEEEHIEAMQRDQSIASSACAFSALRFLAALGSSLLLLKLST